MFRELVHNTPIGIFSVVFMHVLLENEPFKSKIEWDYNRNVDIGLKTFYVLFRVYYVKTYLGTLTWNVDMC